MTGEECVYCSGGYVKGMREGGRAAVARGDGAGAGGGLRDSITRSFASERHLNTAKRLGDNSGDRPGSMEH